MNLDHALNKIIHSVRDALGDTGPNSRFIETLPRFGYRFFPEWLQTGSENEISFDGATGFPIAVLPIDVPNASPELAFAGHRITSALIDALSGLPGLRVRAERTVRHHLTKFADPQRTGESMGVHAVLSGELFVCDHELFLRSELIDVYDGAQLSAAEIESSFPFDKQTERKIADNVLERLKPCLQRLVARKTLTAVG
jgi:TolB-like protein